MSEMDLRTRFELVDCWGERPNPFASEGWLQHCKVLHQRVTRPPSIFKSWARRVVRGGDVPSYFHIPYRHIRRALGTDARLRVLDIGGGCGDNYHIMRQALGADIARLDWYIMDNESSVALGRHLNGDLYSGLIFSTEVPDQSFDVVMIIGALQYFQNWRGLLGAVASVGRPRIFTTRSPLRANGAGFISVQMIASATSLTAPNVIGEANINVIGIADLRDAMDRLGYTVESESAALDYSANFTHFPKEYRPVVYLSTMWLPRQDVAKVASPSRAD
jgi:putative methyltransferase (TIGR04325 family)